MLWLGHKVSPYSPKIADKLRKHVFLPTLSQLIGDFSVFGHMQRGLTRRGTKECGALRMSALTTN